MNWVILKFGGSSITLRGFQSIISRCKELILEEKKIVIVLSAQKNVTTNLLKGNIEEVKQISKELMIQLNFNKEQINKILNLLNNYSNRRELISIGEILSTSIFYEYIKSNQILDLKFLNSKHFIKGMDEYKNDEDIYLSTKYIADIKLFNDLIANENIFVCQGFVGSTINKNEICLIGRGGSDTTASLIGSMLDSELIEIWTDVNGMYTSDPNKISDSKIINQIGYDEAQELAAMGAKVLHPFCILPCKKKNIPIKIKNTYNYNSKNNTLIHNIKTDKNRIYSVTDQHNITVFNIESLDMWNNYGFVYDIFEKFSRYGLDVNIITTSQFTISTTIDSVDKNLINKVYEELSLNYKIELISDCSIISIVGDSIRNQDGINEAMNITKRFNIHMTHYSANDLTISFVLDKKDSLKLLESLHKHLISNNYFYIEKDVLINSNNWWYEQIENVKDLMKNENSLYLYNLNVVENQINILKNDLNSVDNIFYSMKANNNSKLIKYISGKNIGFECVSFEEVNYLRNNLKINNEIIFTPNFCNIEEYEKCMNISNVVIIVDNIELIKSNLMLFQNKKIGIRVDLNSGDGHHQKVITEGKLAKFGSTIQEIKRNIEFFDQNNIIITGLHSHRGSGIQDYKSWYNTAIKLIDFGKIFNTLEWIDLGGGFGVDNENPIDFKELNKLLLEVKKYNKLKIYIEPGRFLVSEAGILLSKVTQVKEKNNINYIGLNTGMNSLIRPCLYDSFHKIHNISKINEIETKIYNIVGPICESGDILGKNRKLPITEIDDIFLIENTGAYGHVMSNNYNMRQPAKEKDINFTMNL